MNKTGIIGRRRLKVQVLMFHRVLPEILITKTNAYSLVGSLISQEFFEQVLSFLQSEGYKFTTISRLSELPSSEKYIALTFDDGYLDNYEYALPSLQKFNATATFFPLVKPCMENAVLPLDIYYHCVEDMNLSEEERAEYYSGSIKRKFYWAEPGMQQEMLRQMFQSQPEKLKVAYMNARQIAQLSDSGFEIGSHGISHSLLVADYMNELKVKEELQKSKLWFETVTGKPVSSYSFPAGQYNARMIELARQAGYLSICLVMRDEKEKEVLPSYARINVSQNSLPELQEALNNQQGKFLNRLRRRFRNFP